MSVLDSIGDYYACARVSRVPPPPAHAVNRGILIEGACSFLSGAVGCGHATTTYGGNIGAIGVTKVPIVYKIFVYHIFYATIILCACSCFNRIFKTRIRAYFCALYLEWIFCHKVFSS